MTINHPSHGLGWHFPVIENMAIILCEPSLHWYSSNLGLMSYYNQSYRKYLLLSRLSLLYCAFYKPSELLGLLKTVCNSMLNLSPSLICVVGGAIWSTHSMFLGILSEITINFIWPYTLTYEFSWLLYWTAS